MLIDLQQPISDMEIFRCVHFSPTQLCVGERFGTSDCTGCKSYTDHEYTSITGRFQSV